MRLVRGDGEAGERRRRVECLRLPVMEFSVRWPARVEDVGGGPVGVEGAEGLEEAG